VPLTRIKEGSSWRSEPSSSQVLDANRPTKGLGTYGSCSWKNSKSTAIAEILAKRARNDCLGPPTATFAQAFDPERPNGG